MVKNPIFSIVVSCYNSRDTIGYLLDSLTRQGIKKDEYEIIISDDYSSEDYYDIIDSYKSKLNIRVIRADHNWGYPGHTRQQGLGIVRGDWIIFSDHDDYFFRDSLKAIKKYIKKNNPKHVIKTTLMVGDKVDHSPKYSINMNNLTHGFLFNRVNVIKQFGIKYNYEDFHMEEDMEFMNYILTFYENDYITIDSIDVKMYCWLTINSNSANSKEKNIAEKTFSHYIKIKSTAYHRIYLMNLILVNRYLDYLIKILIRSYVYLNLYRFINKMNGCDNNMDEENLITAAALLKYIYSLNVFEHRINKNELIEKLYSVEFIEYYTQCIEDSSNINRDNTSMMFYFSQSIEDFIDEVESYINNVKSPEKVLCIK